MMTIPAEKISVEKADKAMDKPSDKPAGGITEKAVEKRRALGRGLESLLPSGPRVVPSLAPVAVPHETAPPADVATTVDPTHPQTARISAAPATERALAEGSGSTTPGVVAQLHAMAAQHTSEGESALEIPLDQVDHNPHQTRLEFEREGMEELASSIRVQGVMQPIAVRPGQNGRYILILGERRLRASKMAGRTTIPVVVKRVSEQQAAEMTIVENLQREDLHCLEQAYAFSHLSETFKMTQEQIGKRVGVSRETVSNYIRLLRLPFPVLQYLKRGDLSYSHARELLGIDDNETSQKVADKVVKERMSVDLLQDMVSNMHLGVPDKKTESPGQGRGRWVDPNVRAAQRQIEGILGMKVRIRDRKGKGKIVIEYASLEDFDRVIAMLKR